MGAPFPGYSADYDWSNYTPVDSTGSNYDKFKSAYKNIRFNVQPTTQIQLTIQDLANLPGLAYRLYGDTSLWRALLAYNGLSDPLSDIAVGMTLKIPTKAAITAYVSKQANNQQTPIVI
jgi:hypothetical protein